MSGAFGVSRPGGVKTTLHRHLRWAGHGGRAASRVQASPGARSPRASGGGRTASPRSPRPRLSRIRHRSWGSRPRLSSCVHVVRRDSPPSHRAVQRCLARRPEPFAHRARSRLVLTSGQRRHRGRSRLLLASEQCRHRARGRFVVASRPRSSPNGWWSWGDGRRHTSLPCPRLRAGTPTSGHEGAASGGKERAPRCEGRRAPSSVSAWSFA